MGKAITYCVQCSQRVSEADLESGKAFRVGDPILCRACAPDSAKSPTSKKISRPSPTGTSVTLKVQKLLPTLPPAPASPAPDTKKLLLIAGGAAAVVVLLLTLVLVFRKGEPPFVVRQPDDPAPPPSTTPVDSRAASAKADLDQARMYAKAHPEDLAGALKRFTDIPWNWDSTEAAAEAKKEEAAIRGLISARVKVWMAEAEDQIQDLLAKGDYDAAAQKMEKLKPTHEIEAWRLAVGRRVSDLFSESRRRKDLELAKKEKEDAEKASAEEKDPPKSVDLLLSEEAKGYRARWEAAVARATARDFGSAIAELERAAAGLREDGVKAEARQDADDLKRLAGLRTSAMDALKKKARGGGMSLAVRQPSGDVKRLGGLVLQTDAERVELQAPKGSVFVEWEDVAASTFVQAAPREARDLAQLCLLEGEIEAAKRFEAALPAKWWAYAGSARGKLPPPDVSEKPARELYYAAERGFRSMETRPAAVENYKTLKTAYAATSLVKAYTERISRRADAGKEYYFAAADFHAEGTIRLAKSGKLESVRDTDESDTLLNLAEAEFAALSGLSYRCWVLVGACCDETFLFYVQGTEITDTDPKTRKRIACEPGTTAATPVKLSIRGLKKTHEEHRPKGAKIHPKTVARWEWIEIPLPRYAAPGAKKLRLMTHHAGFSIVGAVVSSTRKAAPADAELKEIERDRDAREAFPVDPDLVAWWNFEEGGGTQVVDLTGKGHDAKVVGTVQWADGKIGGGIRCTGPGRMLQVEDAEDLRLAGDLTVAVWMKKEGEGGPWSCLVGKGHEQQRNYCLWLEGNTRRVMFQSYGASPVNLISKEGVTDNVWTHVAASVEGSKVTLYINGVKDGEMTRTAPAMTPSSPLGMGWACDHDTYQGILDDVRIYRRGLTAEEIRALYSQAH